MVQPIKIQIRFNDIDVGGHVHNAAYFHYFELARVHYFQHLLGEEWDWKCHGFILAENTAKYLLPLNYGDSPIVSLRVTKIGTKSFSLEYRIIVAETLHCVGSSVIVCFNYLNRKPIPIPNLLNTILIQLT